MSQEIRLRARAQCVLCARPFYSTLQFAEKLRIVCWGFVTCVEIAI